MSRASNAAISESRADLGRRCPELATSKRLNASSLMTFAAVCIFSTGCLSFQQQASERCTKCDALCARAREAREKGNSDQANQYINAALRERPSDSETRREIAETMWKSGRRTEALSVFTALCDQQPQDINLATRLAAMQWESGLHREATDTAEFILNHDPLITDAWRIKARSEVEKGQLDAAFVSYDRLFQLAPDDLTTLVELGELQLKRGHPERASLLFRVASQHPQVTSKQRVELEWSMGVAYARSERWSLAVATLDPAIAQRTATAEDWCILGWSRLQCGDSIGAQHDLRQAFERDPQSVAARDLARCMERSHVSLYSPNRVTPTSYQQVTSK